MRDAKSGTLALQRIVGSRKTTKGCTVPTVEQIIARWRANAAAAGVMLTEEDIERLSDANGIGRVLQVEQHLARIPAWHVTPDFLDKRLADPEGGARG
jgi:hypothetical protein